jgi:hypothetical protein
MLITLAVVLALVYSGAWGFSWWRSRPLSIVETLQGPVALAGWTSDALDLADGRRVKLAGVRNIRADSLALAEVKRNGGVEIGGGGVYGLVKVWHWCGNDRVRRHVARVDVERLLVFLGEADAATPGTAELERQMAESGRRREQPDLSAFGWNVSEFYEFRSFCELADLGPTPPATRPVKDSAAADSPPGGGP